jgi:hypothetical protein
MRDTNPTINANYKGLYILLTFILISIQSNAQNLEVGYDYTIPTGEFGYVYQPGSGFYLDYTNQELGFGYHFSLNFMQPAQDTFIWEVYKNGVLIEGAWQTYKSIAFYRIGIHLQKVLAPSIESKLKPILGGEFNISGYSYEKSFYAKGYMDGLETGGIWMVTIGARAGLLYDINENIRFSARAVYNFGIDFQYIVYNWAQFEIGVAYNL